VGVQDAQSAASEQSRDRKGAVAYFITYHTYGTWLHGTQRGSVDATHNQYGEPFLSEDEQREQNEFIKLQHEPVNLTPDQIAVVDRTIREVCAHRGWSLHELNVRTNHVHVVVNADSTPERILNDLKSYATRRLGEAGLIPKDSRVWTRHGSTRYLWDGESVSRACAYVREGQGADLFEAAHDGERPPLPYGRGSDGGSPPLPHGRGSDQADRSAVMRDVAYRVVADHIRTLTFALTDGAVPSNEGRGYVLRRILRRAVRYGRQFLDMRDPFLHRLVPVVVETMGEAFPELKTAHGGKNVPRVAEIVRDEEVSFIKTLDRGIVLFTELASPLIRAMSLFRDLCDKVSQLPRNSLPALEEIRDLVTDRTEYAKIVTPLAQSSNLEEYENEIRHAEFAVLLLNLVNSIESKNLSDYEYWVDQIDSHISTLSCLPLRIRGKDAFDLYSTYGFPLDLTQVMATEVGLEVETRSFEQTMEVARALSRAHAKQQSEYESFASTSIPDWVCTDDSPKYEIGELETRLVGWVESGRFHSSGAIGVEGGWKCLISESTCFYAEQGGQVGDSGLVYGPNGTYEVEDTRRIRGNAVLHFGRVASGWLEVGDTVRLVVNPRRQLTKSNHTSTHLLNWALRETLGEHVDQKGSLVDPDKTRFDFSHPAQVTTEQLEQIEELVNDQIEQDYEVFTAEVDQARARQVNTLRAVFGEKYPDRVRVVSIGVPVEQLLDDPDNDEWMKYSVEFCGGTHLASTRQAGRFRLIEESAVAKGIRRVTGVSGERATEVERAAADVAEKLTAAEKGDASELPARVAELTQMLNTAELPVVDKARLRDSLGRLQGRAKEAAKQQVKSQVADVVSRTDGILQGAEQVGPAKLIAANLGPASIDQLRAACDSLRDRAGSAAVFLAAESDGKVLLLAAMTKDVVDRGIRAGDVIKAIAPVVGGKGGGRPDMAQGGGPEVDEAVKEAAQWLRAKLGD